MDVQALVNHGFDVFRRAVDGQHSFVGIRLQHRNIPLRMQGLAAKGIGVDANRDGIVFHYALFQQLLAAKVDLDGALAGIAIISVDVIFIPAQYMDAYVKVLCVFWRVDGDIEIVHGGGHGFPVLFTISNSEVVRHVNILCAGCQRLALKHRYCYCIGIIAIPAVMVLVPFVVLVVSAVPCAGKHVVFAAFADGPVIDDAVAIKPLGIIVVFIPEYVDVVGARGVGCDPEVLAGLKRRLVDGEQHLALPVGIRHRQRLRLPAVVGFIAVAAFQAGDAADPVICRRQAVGVDSGRAGLYAVGFSPFFVRP